jgi:hypothetical protein
MRSRVALAGFAGAAAFATVTSVALASCVPMTLAQQRTRAAVIFDGIALEGATPTGIQRFRVIRYLKGSGPTIVRVRTGYRRARNGERSMTSVSIVVARRERWRIFALGSAGRALNTNVCLGSRKL